MARILWALETMEQEDREALSLRERLNRVMVMGLLPGKVRRVHGQLLAELQRRQGETESGSELGAPVPT
jgi:hypothetical protein